MGGGWSTAPNGRGVPLGQRSVSFGPTQPGQHAQPASPAPPARSGRQDRPGEAPRETGTGRHCWVTGDGEGDHPGLVLEWRRGPDCTWWGLTQYLIPGPQGSRAILEWLPAERLRPR